MERSFVLLDDCNATAESPTSRLYTGLAKQYLCTDPAMLDEIWESASKDMAQGLHAAVVADYEWGTKLLNVGRRRPSTHDQGALRVLMFRELQRLDAEQASRWLAQQEGCEQPGPAGVAGMQPSVSRDQFDAGIARIHELIRAGETYQVNYTYRLRSESFGSPVALYRRMRARQPVAFGALVRLPAPAEAMEPEWLLSCSPELFLRHDDGCLTARPMKGTAARSADAEEDRQVAQWLAADTKNRAENLMIVDLLRNDLGRISRIGSVKVPALFTIETYRTVHQMTSTVVSEIPPDVDFPQVLRALYPCGSITGAPKHHTMELIEELESTPRGVYTGGIGWIDAPAAERRCGDFCMSVAIRTLTLGAAREGRRAAQLGVGGGIVLDSTQGGEFDESRLKARFLTELDPGFTLIETMRVRRSRGILRLADHLRRLGRSAAHFGFRFDHADLEAALAGFVAALPDDESRRVRLDLLHDGTPRITTSLVQPVAPQPVKLAMARGPLPEREAAWVGHKTSIRSHYDDAISAAESAGAFDTVFFDARGCLTEGARSNVFVRIDGRWRTPARSCGLLPGVMRQRLLDMPGFATEDIIKAPDLKRADAMLVCSSLRGVLPARWLDGTHVG